MRDWLACLQYATRGSEIGIVGAKLLYPDNRIQYAGTIRNPDAPEWFDHRYRFKPADWGPADIAGPTLAATGACMYIVRGVLDQVGLFDEEYGMGYEDVDYCLRAWQAGYQVVYAPVGATPPPRVDHPGHLRRRTRAQVATGLLASLGRILRRAPGAERRRQTARRVRSAGHSRVRRPASGVRASQRPHRARPRCPAVDTGKRTRLVRSPLPGAELPGLRRARRRARPAASDQGRNLVGDCYPGLARERRQRRAGLPGPGHRDQLLPRGPDAPIRGAGYLSARVQVPHHLDLESSPPGRVGVGCRA